MGQCHKCHGAGFTLHQVAWSMDRVRIFCKTCDGIGYTYKKVMTPTQSKQAAAIMQKYGEEGWRIENHHVGEIETWKPIADPCWNWIYQVYRAVRIERVPTRTPLPIEHYKRGMEVKNDCGHRAIIVEVCPDGKVWFAWGEASVTKAPTTHTTFWKWPNETEWHPAFTETIEERVVETLLVEGL